RSSSLSGRFIGCRIPKRRSAAGGSAAATDRTRSPAAGAAPTGSARFGLVVLVAGAITISFSGIGVKRAVTARRRPPVTIGSRPGRRQPIDPFPVLRSITAEMGRCRLRRPCILLLPHDREYGLAYRCPPRVASHA